MLIKYPYTIKLTRIIDGDSMGTPCYESTYSNIFFNNIEEAQKHIDYLESMDDRYLYELVTLYSFKDEDGVTIPYIEFLQNKLVTPDWNLYPETEPEIEDNIGYCYSKDCWVTVKNLDDNITKVYQARLRNDPRDGRKIWTCTYDSWDFSHSDKVIAWMYFVDNTPEPYVN